jgi:hypothetical protein
MNFTMFTVYKIKTQFRFNWLSCKSDASRQYTVWHSHVSKWPTWHPRLTPTTLPRFDLKSPVRIAKMWGATETGWLFYKCWGSDALRFENSDSSVWTHHHRIALIIWRNPRRHQCHPRILDASNIFDPRGVVTVGGTVGLPVPVLGTGK